MALTLHRHACSRIACVALRCAVGVRAVTRAVSAVAAPVTPHAPLSTTTPDFARVLHEMVGKLETMYKERLQEKDERLKEKDERLKEKDERLKEKDELLKRADEQAATVRISLQKDVALLQSQLDAARGVITVRAAVERSIEQLATAGGLDATLSKTTLLYELTQKRTGHAKSHVADIVLAYLDNFATLNALPREQLVKDVRHCYSWLSGAVHSEVRPGAAVVDVHTSTGASRAHMSAVVALLSMTGRQVQFYDGAGQVAPLTLPNVTAVQMVVAKRGFMRKPDLV